MENLVMKILHMARSGTLGLDHVGYHIHWVAQVVDHVCSAHDGSLWMSLSVGLHLRSSEVLGE